MVENLKKLYVYTSSTNDILEQSFGKSIDLTGFDDLLLSINILSDVDILETEKLMRECNLWRTYLVDINSLTKIYLDKFKNVQEFQNIILEVIKKEKKTPYELLKKCKIKSTEIGDVVAEVIQREQETSQKIKTIKTFTQIIESYINYLTAIFYNLSSIIRGHGSRYWNTSY